MRVVDDLAGQIDGPFVEPLSRLVGVVDGSIDAVAETELACEMDAETSRLEAVVGRLDLRDQLAVIALFENVRDFAAAVEPLAKDQRLHGW